MCCCGRAVGVCYGVVYVDNVSPSYLVLVASMLALRFMLRICMLVVVVPLSVLLVLMTAVIVSAISAVMWMSVCLVSFIVMLLVFMLLLVSMLCMVLMRVVPVLLTWLLGGCMLILCTMVLCVVVSSVVYIYHVAIGYGVVIRWQVVASCTCLMSALARVVLLLCMVSASVVMPVICTRACTSCWCVVCVLALIIWVAMRLCCVYGVAVVVLWFVVVCARVLLVCMMMMLVMMLSLLTALLMLVLYDVAVMRVVGGVGCGCCGGDVV